MPIKNSCYEGILQRKSVPTGAFSHFSQVLSFFAKLNSSTVSHKYDNGGNSNSSIEIFATLPPTKTTTLRLRRRGKESFYSC